MRYTLIESKKVKRTTYELVQQEGRKTIWITKVRPSGQVDFLHPFMKEEAARRAWKLLIAIKEAKEA